ncbi:MAG: hypothetical protein ACTSXD_05025 [Candidatus Heimdallarchaeaceae archaeon]
MGITTVGLSILAAAVAGSYPVIVGPGGWNTGVGISGLTFASGNTALGSEFFDKTGHPNRNQINEKDLGTPEQVTFISNWAPNDISGCVLREYGIFTAGSQLLNREVLTGSLVFDGEQELQTQTTVLFKI